MAVASVEERELLKTISWFDGFVVALANPSFLITAIGGSALSLGGWGAAILWTVSVLLGALHNYIYSETAAMFPKLSGGIAIYAHEAWKRYFSFIGPIAAFGYWIGWSWCSRPPASWSGSSSSTSGIRLRRPRPAGTTPGRCSARPSTSASRSR